MIENLGMELKLILEQRLNIDSLFEALKFEMGIW